jgi:hypothetical protein
MSVFHKKIFLFMNTLGYVENNNSAGGVTRGRRIGSLYESTVTFHQLVSYLGVQDDPIFVGLM